MHNNYCAYIIMGSIEDYDNYKSIESDSVLLIILIVQILNLILKTKLSMSTVIG